MNTITEKKNTLEGINSRLDNTEEWISDLEDRFVELTQSKQQRAKWILKSENSLRDVLDYIKPTNIHIIGLQGEERQQRAENLFEEILAENFLTWGRKPTSRSW